ncbi:MAG: sulfite exporter TauE/SafE family protein [Methylobacteriaceae bacterium]|nr:sulfite exporter TauE/SafE family protein [Methylobacteriaceae bacterium]
MFPAFEPFAVVVSALTFLLAGFIKGVIGLGLPTVSMGLLTVIMAPVEAAALLIVPSFVTNVWQLAAGPRFGALVRRLWPMMAGVVIGTLAGKGFMQGDAADRAVVALGVVLIAYAVLGLTHFRFSVRPAFEWWLAPLIGLTTGLITAATGVFVIPAVPYLGALGLAKDDLIQALGLSFTVSTVALTAALAFGGSFQATTAGASLLALVPAILGMIVGGWVRGQVSENMFRRCFFVSLFVLGAHLASRAIF